MRTLQKHLLKEISLYTFIALLLVSFTIDLVLYSIRAHYPLSVYHWIEYLFCQKSLFLSILLPISFLIASLFIFFQKRKNFEFLALLASGISRKKTLLPFLLFSLFLSSLLVLNDHFFHNYSKNSVDQLKASFSKHKKTIKKDSITVLNLNNHKIIFNEYDPHKRKLRDLYIIKSPTKIYHIDSYFLEDQIAFNVDLIEKKGKGLTKTNSFLQKKFSLDEELIKISHLDVEKINLTTLFKLSKYPSFSNEKKNQISSQIHKKIGFFLIPILLFFLIYSLLFGCFQKGFVINAASTFSLLFSLYFFIYLFTALYPLKIIPEYSLYMLFSVYLIALRVKESFLFQQ